MNFSVQDVATGWVEGLRAHLGPSGVVDIPYDAYLTFYDGALGPDHDFKETRALANRAVRSVLYDTAPDVVVVISGFFTTPQELDLFRARGHRLVLITTESPYVDDKQLSVAPFYDLVLVNDPTNLDAYRQLTAADYVPHAYRPHIHRPGPATVGYESDFCVVGTGYPDRIAFLEAVDWSGIDVALGGNWQQTAPDSPLRKFVAHDIDSCLDNEQTVELYRSTKMSANIYRQEANRPDLRDGWAMGPREVELAACGTFFATQPRGENREVLPMVPTFVGPDDLGEQIRWWLARPDERAVVAEQARAAIADRTFTNHAALLLRKV